MISYCPDRDLDLLVRKINLEPMPHVSGSIQCISVQTDSWDSSGSHAMRKIEKRFLAFFILNSNGFDYHT